MSTRATEGNKPAKSESLGRRCPTTMLSVRPDSAEGTVDVPDLGNDRYELCEEIERGGMGIIYRAKDLQLEREVAIKVLRGQYAQNSHVTKAILTEACVMSYLSHPGVTPIYDRGACRDGRPYYVMKLIDGVTLTEIMSRPQQKRSELLRIFADVARTIAFAHSRNVIHLDLKPGNVMVGEFGEVYVMDWGLARFGSRPESDQQRPDEAKPDEPARHDQAQHVNGTPDYMAPEQARGKPLDARTDVFGLGAMLCEILIGRAPYQGDNVREIYAHAIKGSVRSAFKDLEQSDADRALTRLAKKCLSPQRNVRPANAMEVAQEMSAYQASALERVESDMNRFFQLSLDLFCIAGFDGFFRRINPNFSRVLGHSEDELLSRPFLDFVHEADRQETLAQMQVLSDGQPVVQFRNRYLTASGEYITLEWMAKAIENEGIIFAVARDVTASAR